MSGSKHGEGEGSPPREARAAPGGDIDPRERPEHYLPLDRRRAAAFLGDWEDRVRGQLRRHGAEEDDVLYRVFDRALGGLPRFRGESRISTWLYRITYREALRHLERRGRLRDREQPLEDAPEPPVAEPDPSELLERKEDAAVLRRAMASLDPRDREILALRYLEDLKLNEVADRLEIPLGTVKTRIHRALARLRRELDRD